MSVPVSQVPSSSLAMAESTLQAVVAEAEKEISEARESLKRAILKRAKAQAGLYSLGVTD